MPKARVKLPVYQSLAECLQRTGIPIALLRDEKKRGNKGFAGSRVDLELFLRDYFDPEKDGADEVYDKEKETVLLMREKREGERLANEKERGTLVNGEELKARLWEEQLGPLRQQLERMPQTLAPILNPKEPQAALTVLRNWWEQTKGFFREPEKKQK